MRRPPRRKRQILSAPWTSAVLKQSSFLRNCARRLFMASCGFDVSFGAGGAGGYSRIPARVNSDTKELIPPPMRPSSRAPQQTRAFPDTHRPVWPLSRPSSRAPQLMRAFPDTKARVRPTEIRSASRGHYAAAGSLRRLLARYMPPAPRAVPATRHRPPTRITEPPANTLAAAGAAASLLK